MMQQHSQLSCCPKINMLIVSKYDIKMSSEKCDLESLWLLACSIPLSRYTILSESREICCKTYSTSDIHVTRQLLQIRGKDCVAIEVRYHRLCHKAYTKYLLVNESRQSEPSLQRTAYDGECFKKFFLFIEEKILEQGEIVRMTKLCDVFNQMLK